MGHAVGIAYAFKRNTLDITFDDLDSDSIANHKVMQSGAHVNPMGCGGKLVDVRQKPIAMPKAMHSTSKSFPEDMQ